MFTYGCIQHFEIDMCVMSVWSLEDIIGSGGGRLQKILWHNHNSVVVSVPDILVHSADGSDRL